MKNNNLNPCKRYNVYAIGFDSEGNYIGVRNGNKDECSNEVGNCGCIHAEESLLSVMPDVDVVLLSHSPCLDCAKLLRNVTMVMYLEEYRKKDGLIYLESEGVPTQHIKGDALKWMLEKMNY